MRHVSDLRMIDENHQPSSDEDSVQEKLEAAAQPVEVVEPTQGSPAVEEPKVVPLPEPITPPPTRRAPSDHPRRGRR